MVIPVQTQNIITIFKMINRVRMLCIRINSPYFINKLTFYNTISQEKERQEQNEVKFSNSKKL